MPAAKKPLFFIHIPKTAGTSFREAAMKRWGKSRVCSDYGDSRHSSDVVRTLVHTEQDYYSFQNHLNAKRIRMLSAHAPVKFYRRIFDASQLVTFLREPVERTISHYYTACSKQGFTGSFEAFCNIPEHQNVQSRYLEQMPLEAIGFIGLTEQYADSVRIFNKSFSEKLRVLSLNQYAGAHADAKSALTETELACAQAINREDTALYHVARQLFATRMQLNRENKPYTHGKIQRLTCNRIEGWALNNGKEQAVSVEILLNGERLIEKSASAYVANLKERNIGRGGYVGFVHTFYEPLNTQDKIQVRVKASGQILRGPTTPAVKSPAADKQHNNSNQKTQNESLASVEKQQIQKEQPHLSLVKLTRKTG